ncbi:MAG: AAA family ATPase [Candidatus Diapherotrites archaeon]
MLLVFFGLPATGKTFLAKEISKTLGLQYLNMDNSSKNSIESQLFFCKMGEFLEEKILTGKGVVVDGSFCLKSEREMLKEIAERKGIPIFFIEMTASRALIGERMTGNNAMLALYNKMQSQFEPMLEPHLVVDSSMPFKKQVERVKFYLQKKGK